MSNHLPQPPLKTPLFEALYEVIKQYTLDKNLGAIDVYDVDNVDSSVLLHLAEQFDILGYKGWFLADTLAKQKTLVKGAIALHGKAGTYYSVEKALENAGFPVAAIVENPALAYDGSWVYNGEEMYSGKRWARFIVEFGANPPADKAELIKKLINVWKPVRSHRIQPPEILYYDGWKYDGTETWDGYK